jgi:hypothetical protein
MGRIEEQTPGDRRPGRCRSGAGSPGPFARLATRSTASLLMIAGRSLAGDGDGPELMPPTEMPVVSRPAAPAPAPPPLARPSPRAQGSRAVLALPGITTPSSTATPSTAPPESTPGGLSLDAPIEMRGVPSPARPVPSVVPDRSPRPLVLESSPMGEPVPIDGVAPGSNLPNGSSTTAPRIDPRPIPAPPRRGRFFGRFPTPAPPPSPAPSATLRSSPGRSVAEVPREDPAAESALKRRIERQAREAVGDRARSVEVRVVGKGAVVQARGVKFFQKRAVRKSLESIPALSGLRSTIEVVD